MGISFSGGLSIVAAGRPSLAAKVAYVFSFGGHDDLPRVLRYLCTGVEPYPSGLRIPELVRLKADATDNSPAPATRSVRHQPDQSPGGIRLQPDQDTGGIRLQPDGQQAAGGIRLQPDQDKGGIRLQPDGSGTSPVLIRAPHDYGVAVILLGMTERLVPAAQVDPLRAAIRRYLLASALDSNVDKAAATKEFDALRELANTLPEPSATLLRYVNDRDVVHLGARLLPYVSAYGGAPALSVSKSPKPTSPVFLLHGSEDNVIPSLESEYLANDLRGHATVHVLLSGLISHAEADRAPHVSDVVALASFWGDLLSR
jgi:hypothetical protein